MRPVIHCISAFLANALAVRPVETSGGARLRREAELSRSSLVAHRRYWQILLRAIWIEASAFGLCGGRRDCWGSVENDFSK